MNTNGKFTLYNFGPVKKAIIELNKFTVFIGPQATGKTLISQLIYFIRNYKEFLSWDTHTFLVNSDYSIKNPQWKLDEFFQKLAWWYGDAQLSMLSPNTKILWEDNDNEYIINFEDFQIDANDEFIKYLSQGENKKRLDPTSFYLLDDYIPAERIIASFISHYQFPKFPSWPGYIYKFYESLGSSLEFWSRRKEGEYFDPMGGGGWAGASLFMQSSKNLGLLIEEIVLEILQGKIQYDEQRRVWLDSRGKMLEPRNLASGQMDFWPIWTLLSTSYYSLIRAHYNKTTFIDEPEAHMHPRAQKRLIDLFCLLDSSFVLTTHSPFILYSLNNKMAEGQFAEKSLSEEEKIKFSDLIYGPNEKEFIDFVKEKPQILALMQPGLVNAYNFSEDGLVDNIIDSQTKLIKEDYLEEVARELDKDFIRYLEEIFKD
ncbi:MAG: AAA family ATPase [Candidatus Helarchaeota archaeon]